MEPAKTFRSHGQHGECHQIHFAVILIKCIQEINAIAFPHPGKLADLIQPIAESSTGRGEQRPGRMLSRSPMRPAHSSIDEIFTDSIEYFEALDDCAFPKKLYADFTPGKPFNIGLHALKGLEIQRRCGQGSLDFQLVLCCVPGRKRSHNHAHGK